MTTTEAERAVIPSAGQPGSAAVTAGARPALVSRQLVLYTLIGAGGVVLDFLLFLFLFHVAGLHEQIASAIGITAAIVESFTLNTLFNFRKTDRLLGRFARFYAVGTGGIALTFVLLAVFAGPLGLDPTVVKACSLPLVLVFQYSLNRRWSFA